jgi:hypothetical protein
MNYNAAPCAIGEGPFVFVSYAHDDLPFVSSVVEGIVSSGYKVWYDKNIDVTSIWSDEIANAILASKVFVVFVTKASMASQYVRAEVEFALSKKVKVIPVYLEGMDVLPPGLSLVLHSTQGLEGNNPQIVIFRICKWLTQNWEENERKRTEPALAAHHSGEQDREKKSFWSLGRRAKSTYTPQNERAPKVLGQARGVPTASSFLLKWLLRIVLFVNLTEIIQAYQTSGLQTAFFTGPFLQLGLSSIVMYWYFARRFSGPYSLFSLFGVLRLLQSALYWVFFLGWLLAVLNLDNLKIWALWIAQISTRFRFPYMLNYQAIHALDLPLIPDDLRSIGFLAVAVCGVFFVIDMIGELLRRKF